MSNKNFSQALDTDVDMYERCQRAALGVYTYFNVEYLRCINYQHLVYHTNRLDISHASMLHVRLWACSVVDLKKKIFLSFF